MKTKKLKYLFLLLIPLLLSGCMNDDSLYDFHKLVVNKEGRAVFIINEGNFMYGNASLSYYNPQNGDVLNDIFYNTNALPLGDVATSMSIMDSLCYVVVNNSGKIYIINANTFKYVGKITGLTSPRNIYFVNRNKAYVTDLYAKAITIVDPATRQITGSISVDNHNTKFYQHSSEQMVFLGKYAFVNSWSYDDKILIINTLTDKLTDSITVVKQPNSMVLDKNNKLWVLSDGGFKGSAYGQDTAALTCIDPVSRKVEALFRFPDLGVSPSGLCLNAAGDSLFFLYNNWVGKTVSNAGVYAMNVEAHVLPDMPLIPQKNHLFYALAVDPGSGHIYVSDARDFLSRGEVYVFSGHAVLLDSLQVGIIPGGFCFK